MTEQSQLAPTETESEQPEELTPAEVDQLPEQFEFAEWRLTVKGKPETMQKLVDRLENTQVGRQLARGRRMLAATGLERDGGR